MGCRPSCLLHHSFSMVQLPLAVTLFKVVLGSRYLHIVTSEREPLPPTCIASLDQIYTSGSSLIVVMSFSNGNLEKVQLNNEELQKLLNKMSSDERKELTDTLRSCTSEVTMTRGLPITAAVLGSLYFARTRLPAQYHFGPKGWPFYAIMGIGTLTTVNVFSMGSCRERVQPLIARMWQKYNIGHSSTSYEEIRRRHRQEQGFRTPDAGHAAHARSRVPEFSALTDQTYGNMTDSYGISTDTMPANDGSMSRDYTKPRGERTFDLSQDGSPGAADSRRTPMPPQGYMYGSEAPSYMSGTPVTPRGAQSPSSDEYFR